MIHADSPCTYHGNHLGSVPSAKGSAIHCERTSLPHSFLLDLEIISLLICWMRHLPQISIKHLRVHEHIVHFQSGYCVPGTNVSTKTNGMVKHSCQITNLRSLPVYQIVVSLVLNGVFKHVRYMVTVLGSPAGQIALKGNSILKPVVHGVINMRKGKSQWLE